MYKSQRSGDTATDECRGRSGVAGQMMDMVYFLWKLAYGKNLNNVGGLS